MERGDPTGLRDIIEDGGDVRYRIFILAILVFGIGAFPGGFQPVNAQQLLLPDEDTSMSPVTLCGCSDLSKMRRRLQEAQIAIGALNLWIQIVRGPTESDIVSGNLSLYYLNAYIYDYYQSEIAGQISSARFVEPPTGLTNLLDKMTPSFTRASDCQIVITPLADQCLHESLSEHENIHSNMCMRTKALYGSAWGRPYPLSLLEATYLETETKGYQAEIDFLSAEIRQIGSVCSGQPVPAGSPVDLGRINDLDLLRELSVAR
jgi:hypothetical protein